MASNTAPAAPAVADTVAEVNTIDRAEVNRVVARIKHELSQFHADANRKRPLFSSTSKEAGAKLASALKVLDEFAGQLDSIKNR